MRERGSGRDTERVHIERHRDTEREGQGETQRGNWGEILWERECADCQRERERGRDTERDTERERVHVERERHTHTNSSEEIHRERDRERG